MDLPSSVPALDSSAGAAAGASQPRDCTVCAERPRGVVFTACGHSVLCQPCLERLLRGDSPKCPVCKTAVLPNLRSWMPLHEAVTALAPAATYMPTAVDPEVAAAAAAAASEAARRQPSPANDVLALRAALPRAVANLLLSHGATRGDAALVRILVTESGADPNARDESSGRAPLHCAAQAGSVDCVRALVELGANVACTDNLGLTPLSLATREGHGACVEALEALSAAAPRGHRDQPGARVAMQPWRVARGRARAAFRLTLPTAYGRASRRALTAPPAAPAQARA